MINFSVSIIDLIILIVLLVYDQYNDRIFTRCFICSAGEDNKKVLLDLGAVDYFLKLLQHEDRIVRRNACMAFGLMTSHG